MTSITTYGYAGHPNDADGGKWSNDFANDNELFLRVFGGEVLTAFEKAIEVSPRIMSRTIPYGKSASFPIHGRAHARHHKPGEDILDQTLTGTTFVDVSGDGSGAGRPIDYTSKDISYLSNLGAEQKQILINDLMLATVFIDDLEEAKAHYDLRSAYTSELGKALARRVDNLAVRALVAASDPTTPPPAGPLRGGQHVTDSNMNTQADVCASSIITAAQLLDEHDVPTDERFAILPPSMYYLLLRAAGGIGTESYAALLSRDYSMGNGDFAEGRVLMVAGVPIIVTNNGGFGINFTAEQGQVNTDLNVNMTNIVGVVAHKSAAGMVKLKDLQVESEYMIQNQGNLFVSKMACGLAPLRTDAAVRLRTSA